MTALTQRAIAIITWPTDDVIAAMLHLSVLQKHMVAFWPANSADSQPDSYSLSSLLATRSRPGREALKSILLISQSINQSINQTAGLSCTECGVRAAEVAPTRHHRFTWTTTKNSWQSLECSPCGIAATRTGEIKLSPTKLSIDPRSV